MDNKLSDLTIIIVTFRTNISILKDCLKSIDPSVKVLIVENSDNFINSLDIIEYLGLIKDSELNNKIDSQQSEIELLKTQMAEILKKINK